MSPTTTSRGGAPPRERDGARRASLAGRAGRWSAGHRKIAVVGWLLFVVLATLLAGAVGQRNVPASEQGNGESKRGDMLVAAGGYPDVSRENVLVQGTGSLTARDARVTAAAEDVVDRLRRLPGASNVRSPVRGPDRSTLVSHDGRSLLVTFDLPGAPEDNEQRVAAPLRAVAAAGRAHPGVRVEEFGDASQLRGVNEADAASERTAETFSYSATVVILLVAFGAIVAAGVPLLLGATAVVAAIGLLGPLSRIHPLSPQVSIVVLLVGLAVGVDYAMFYLRREADERLRGRTPEAAVEIAAATSGRAVLVSGLTVMVAMAGMLVAGNPIFVAFGLGTMLVVAVAVAGSLTFLPATLAFLGRKGWTEKARVPWVARRRRATRGESRMWSAILDVVLRRPLASAVLAGGALAALAIPALGLTLKNPGLDGYSRDVPIVRAYDRLQAAFPGGATPAVVVVKGRDVTEPKTAAAIRRLHDAAIATGRLTEPSRVEINPDRTVARVMLSVEGSGTDAVSERSVRTLRDRVIPATVGRLPDTEVAVTGPTANSKDFLDVMKGRLPIVFGFVLGLAFVILLVTFRSIVVPIKAIVLNLLSVGAAYGLLVLVFQDGHGERLLDFRSVGGITSWLPLFLFVVLFGLSMDYHVFILTRVREGVDRGISTADAVRHGIKSTAGIVTSAAAVMIAVFASFSLSTSPDTKQLAIGLAAAVLIDATVVRAVLLPATMTLLGERNWYLPRRLSWLPQVGSEPSPEPARS